MLNLRRISALFITVMLCIQVLNAQQDPNDYEEFQEKTAEEMMSEKPEKKNRGIKLGKLKKKKSKNEEAEAPKVTAPAANQPTEAQPIITQPAVAEPVTTPPTYTKPQNSAPVSKSPFGSRPPVSSSPFGSRPASTQPARPEQPAEPAQSQPALTQPNESRPVISQPIENIPSKTEAIEAIDMNAEKISDDTRKIGSEAKKIKNSSERAKIRDSKSLFGAKKNRDDTDDLDLNEQVRIDVGNSEGENAEYGILGKPAPDFDVEDWWDEDGNKSEYYITDYTGKVLVIFCWADWCPACKSHGYDEMLAIQDKYLDNPQVEMLAIQTVWEGKMQNTKAKVAKVRDKYGFKIPMAYDDGDVSTAYRSSILTNYKTAGTPWFIVVDQRGKVIFNYHHLPLDATEKVIDSLLN